MSFTSERLASMLDSSTIPTIHDLMAMHVPESSFLTFSTPGVARVLGSYERTFLANRSAFSDPFRDELPQGVEPRVASPDDIRAFPPNRFGFVHLRWTALGPNVLMNAMRWLRPGGVLMVESPDPYPVLNMARSPYQAVASAAVERLGLPLSLLLPAKLFKMGFTSVGCKHVMPKSKASKELLSDLVSQGGSWPDLLETDLSDWQEDPASKVPFLMNIMAWGVKPDD